MRRSSHLLSGKQVVVVSRPAFVRHEGCTADGSFSDLNGSLSTMKQSRRQRAASDAQAKPLSFDLQCNHDQRLIAEELASMTNIATAGSRVVGASASYQAMFSQANKNEPGFEIQVQTKYRKLSQLAFDNTYKVKVTCITFECVDMQGNARFAWASPSQKTINICPNWFDNAKKARAADVLRDCQSNSPNSPNWSRLSQFKASKGAYIPRHIALFW